MPRLRALTSWADRKRGDEFDASDGDARLLCAADALGGAKAELVDRALKAIADEPAEPEPEPKQTEKRRYMRRDLRAQR